MPQQVWRRLPRISGLYGIFLSLVVLMSIHKDIFLCKNKDYHILPNYHTMSLGIFKITE